MIKEKFRYIEYSNEKVFTKESSGKISLKEYTDDLIFLANFDSTFNAQYAIATSNPSTISGTPIIAAFDAFVTGQHAELNGSITYDEENFRTLLNEGSIKFRLQSEFNNAFGYQKFKNANPGSIPSNDTYGFILNDGGVEIGEYSFTLSTTATNTDIFNEVSNALNGVASVLRDDNNLITISSTTYGNSIVISEPTTAGINSLITLMGGVEESVVPNGPTVNVDFLTLAEASGNNNKIILTHDTNSHILLKMYDGNGNLSVDEDLGVWSNQPENYYAFELDFNEQIGQLFIDGILKKVFMTGFSRIDPKTYLTLSGASSNYHSIDELIIYNSYQNTKNYTVETSPLTPYSMNNPYIDIHYGNGFKENEIKDAVVTGTDDLHFVVKISNTWYYFQSGSWRTSNGTFNQSTAKDLFEANFTELFFNEDYDVIIRVFFNSDGLTEVSLDEIAIYREVGDEAAAHITSDIQISTVDLSTDFNIDIVTNQGQGTVDLRVSANDVTAVTLEELKSAIRLANIPGLETVTDDGNGRLTLVATTTGKESYIEVTDSDSNSALALVWGEEESDYGEDDTLTSETTYIDYSELFRWVRSRLGAPLVPVELTDEHLEDCLEEAVYYYNKWRNFDENVTYTNLIGDPKNGWEIPAIVGGEMNIVEVIIEPRYPVAYYAGHDDFYSNLFMQQIFNKEITQTAADYYISLSASKDINILLNTQIAWEVINKRLFITPLPSNSFKVAIKYKSALTIDQIVSSLSIKRLVLALAKIVLGNIRSTFGNQIPGGDGMLQLNGSELKSEGEQERQSIIDGWKRETNVYEFLIG
ncbi:MAG: hypothetical protein ACOC1O_00440 [bacterium]